MLQNHTFYPALGGIENYLYHLSRGLLELGHQPVIFCEKHNDRLLDSENWNGVEIIRHPYFLVSKPMLFIKPRIVSNEIKQFLSRHVEDIDLIISRYPHYCFASCSLNLKIPIFYGPATVYWRYVQRSSENSGIKGRFFNYCWKPIFDHMEKESIIMSNRVVTLSRCISNSLTEYYGFESKKIIVNPPGVDLERFQRSKCPMEIRREFDIPKNRVVVLYIGRLSLEKNVERLIKDFSRLKGKNIHLLIVGDGPQRQTLEQLTKQLGMRSEVTFAGLRKDVERFYRGSDIFVSPSTYEAFGHVILEAMAAQLPCIAFKKVLPEYEVAAEEIIQDGITGFCVNPYDRNELLRRLLCLIENPDIRKRMGDEGRKVCEKKFTWEGHVKELLDLANS